ncbi:MAG TPA: hypothetical protein DD435_15330 [Cyanobacteria bacterium UBA8530]|nr:hypothetical protein [Cyanobacteria bacterium UBA8530]
MSAHYVMAVMLNNRIAEAPKFQEVITRHGCLIKVRLGIHEISKDSCAPNGLILLQLEAEEKDLQVLENDLNSLEGVKTQAMELEF